MTWSSFTEVPWQDFMAPHPNSLLRLGACDVLWLGWCSKRSFGRYLYAVHCLCLGPAGMNINLLYLSRFSLKYIIENSSIENFPGDWDPLGSPSLYNQITQGLMHRMSIVAKQKITALIHLETLRNLTLSTQVDPWSCNLNLGLHCQYTIDSDSRVQLGRHYSQVCSITPLH